MKKRIMMVALSMLFMTSCQNREKSITIYTRDRTSGTRDGFFTGIGFSAAKEDNAVLAKGYIEVASNGDMITSVKNDEYSIGYISLSSLDDTQVKGLIFEGVKPSEENVLNSTYTLTRNFNYCLRKEYKDMTNKEISEAFIAYLSTVEGKATIKSHGGILFSSSEDKSWNDIKVNYQVASLDNSSKTLVIGGSTSVKSIVSSLLVEFSKKCGNFSYSFAPTGSADAFRRTNGSEKDGANYCDLAFASREFNADEKMDDSLKGKMCIDAIVPVVNKSNQISEITKKQLVDIYNGTVSKWSELK